MDGLLAEHRILTDILLKTAVSECIEDIKDIKSAVRQLKLQCDIMVNMVTVLENPVEFFHSRVQFWYHNIILPISFS